MSLEFKDIAQFEHLWKSNGKLADGQRMKLEDALATTNAPLLMPKVIQNIVKEEMEPLLIGTSLLQRVNYTYGQVITYPAMGALQAADIAEGQEYPEVSPAMGGSTVIATIGKVGIAVKVTEEMIRYSQYDIIGMLLRKAGRALARHKEEKIFNHIRSSGVPVFDNLTPASSIFGVCTGRDMSGAANGSVTADNIFDAYGQIVSQGFHPNVMLMHPLTWTMFVKDATLRSFVFNGMGMGNFFAPWTGDPAAKASWAGGLGVSPGQSIIPGGSATGETATTLAGYNANTIKSAPRLPGYMNIPLTVLVSPYVPFDPRRKLTDIYMFDSSELGILFVDEEVSTEEFNDPRVDIRKIKLRERYSIGILNEGHAIAVIKNVHVVPNEVVLPAVSQISVSGSIAPISPTANIFG